MFVCLGWGSLIWCQKTLPIAGAWQSDGPDLPIEFARESGDKRITLVVCDGAPVVKTLWGALAVQTLDAAKEALAVREGVKPANIRYSVGWWSPTGVSQHPGAEAIAEWAAGRHLQGVVWTALKPKLGSDYRVPTQDEVIKHLARLQGTERDVAEEYIRLTPRQITTPYRKAIENALGWTATGRI
ncbi:MAG: hypothetical protein M9945_04090 [Aquamicrobium sp.]|uniref:hypothetical protein n=1 Tax=Aquamicrobium sp. TaxID=1872579 RepID=UPI00349EDAB2|nr:hypothetical protein [Aquamicrobium sp.]